MTRSDPTRGDEDQDDLPVQVARWATEQGYPPEKVMRVITDLRRCPADVLVAFADSGWASGLHAAILACDPDPRIRAAAATSAALPDQFQHQLATGPDPQVRAGIARATRSGALLDALAGDQESKVRLEVCFNEHIWSGTLIRLVRDPDMWVRCACLEQERTPVAAVRAMLADPDDHVRSGAAADPRLTTAEVIAALGDDPIPEVRHALRGRVTADNFDESRIADLIDTNVSRRRLLAGLPGTPPETLWDLAGSDDLVVLGRLATNPALTPVAAERMAPAAIRAAHRSHHVYGDTTVFEHRKPALELAANPNSPPRILDQLAGLDLPGIPLAAAGNPNSGPSLLVDLAGHDDPTVRAAVAGNPNCPTDLLGVLADDGPTTAGLIARSRLDGT